MIIKVLYPAIGILKIIVILIVSWYRHVLLRSVEAAMLTLEISYFLHYFKRNGLNFKSNSFENNEIKQSVTQLIFYAVMLIIVAILERSAFMALFYLAAVLIALELIRMAMYMFTKKGSGNRQST